MADIELVIKIPEEDFERCKKKLQMRLNVMAIAIAKGTPLPKGHGRLIDESDLLNKIELEDNDSNREDNVGEIITLEDIDFIPTIIPADTETWNGIHAQITAPKGTFDRIFNDADDDDNDI
jgi:hypothetical protein